MNEIEQLLQELRAMKNEGKNIPNNKDTWSKISQRDLEGLGFSSEEEMKQWILENPYSNI